ncbi:MAG: NUDIX hydrolase [Candidatus Woesearchaeota archaeon]
MPEPDKIKYHRPPMLTTDVIIEYDDGHKSGIVLIERRNYPVGLAIPGGFAELGLTLGQNAVKEAKEETGLDVIVDDAMRPFLVSSDPSRDPRGHMVSVAYIAKGYGALRHGIFDDAKNPTLYSLDEVRDLVMGGRLVFDHGNILREYLAYRGYGI